MQEFIIGGPGFFPRVVEAATQSLARRMAIIRSFKAGKHEPEALRECWAKPATWDNRYDHDLLPYEPLPIYETNIIERSW